MVFIRLKSQRSDTESDSKKKKKKKKQEKGKFDDEEGGGSYQPHIVEHSISIFLKNLRKSTAPVFLLMVIDAGNAVGSFYAKLDSQAINSPGNS